MMVAIYLTMLAALGLAHLDRPVLSRISAGLCLVLTVWLFLWEIYSPETGFRMPWIDTRLETSGDGAAA